VSITIRQANADDAVLVGNAVTDLIHELFPEDAATYPREMLVKSASELLAGDSSVWAFIAVDGDGQAAGVMTLNECAAISVGGRFGEIYELYVSPEHRSKGVGLELIKVAAEFGRSRGWPLLEVGAPDVPRWQRTVDFYLTNGFNEIGPRLELLIDRPPLAEGSRSQ
jgi:GNAT superfamily N-acetyltransferase